MATTKFNYGPITNFSVHGYDKSENENMQRAFLFTHQDSGFDTRLTYEAMNKSHKSNQHTTEHFCSFTSMVDPLHGLTKCEF